MLQWSIMCWNLLFVLVYTLCCIDFIDVWLTSLKPLSHCSRIIVLMHQRQTEETWDSLKITWVDQNETYFWFRIWKRVKNSIFNVYLSTFLNRISNEIWIFIWVFVNSLQKSIKSLRKKSIFLMLIRQFRQTSLWVFCE